MNHDAWRWRRAAELFDELLPLDPAARAAKLGLACGSDALLRRRVERLLEADADAAHLDEGVEAYAGGLLHEDPANRIGKWCGPYRIERVIGGGGMGDVYLARHGDRDFDRAVALKLMRTGLGGVQARQRFLAERRVLARLEHPNIARLYDGGFASDGQPWYCMEWIDGASLIDWCDQRSLPLAGRLRLFAKVCDAVDFAHRHLIVHRDIKPANILVDAQGEPRLLDFGIAKRLAGEDSGGGGQTALMTPDYAAPEQLRGEPVSTATDVYSLGAVLFELLTGTRPFADMLASREPPLASRACLVTATPERGMRTHHALRAAMRGDLDRMLRVTLDPAPERRYRSANALAEDLRAVAEGRPISLRSDRRYRLGKFVRRHRWSVAASAAGLLALLMTSGVALWQARIAEQRTHAALAVKDFVTSLLESASPDTQPGQKLSVREALDRGRERLAPELAQQPAVEAELLTVMARSYASLGDLETAWKLLDRARGLAGHLNAEARADLYATRLELASRRGGLAAMRVEAAALQRLLPDVSGSPARVNALLALTFYLQADNPEEAESNAREALGLAREILPRHDPRRVRAMRMLADTWDMSGRDQQAQALHERALTIALRDLPRQHPETSALRLQLVSDYVGQRRYAFAAQLARQALADTVAVYGEASPETVGSLCWTARILMTGGRYREARPYMERAQAIMAQRPEDSLLYKASVALQTARIEEAAGDLQAAQRSYQTALDELTDTGRDVHSLPYLRLNVARLLMRQGRHSDAEALYRQVRDAAKPDSAAYGLALTGLGTLARIEGDAKRASTLHRLAAQKLEGHREGRYRSTEFYALGAQLELARDQRHLGRQADSRSTLEQVVKALDANFPFEAPELVDAYFELASLSQGGLQQQLMDRGTSLRRQIQG